MLYLVSMDLDPIFSHPIHENTSPGQGMDPCSGGHVTSPPLAALINGVETSLRNHFIDPEYALRARIRWKLRKEYGEKDIPKDPFP